MLMTVRKLSVTQMQMRTVWSQ